MNSTNPYKSPDAESAGKRDSSAPPKKSQAWQAVLVIFAVIGYLLGYWARTLLGLSGALPGALFGGVGVALAVGVAMVIKAVVDPKAKI